MTDLDLVERELTAGLKDLASKSRPPTDAWERFELRRTSPTRNDSPIDSDSPIDDDVDHDEVGLHRVAADPESMVFHRAGASAPTAAAGPRRRSVVLTSAAVVLVFAAVVAALLVVRADDRSSTASPVTTDTGIDLRGADGNLDALEAFTLVVEAYEAFNAGDEAAWLAVRAAPQAEILISEVSSLAELMAVDARYEIDHCTYVGFDEYAVEGHPGFPPVEAHQFVCTTTLIDPFIDAAGISFRSPHRWLVNDGRILDVTSDDWSEFGQRAMFIQKFSNWVQAEHPQRGADGVVESIDLLDEFVAADGRYPLGE